MTTPADHLVPLPGTEWTIWREAALRTAGFPADGLLRFAEPECAAVADAVLDGTAERADFDAAYAAAGRRTGATACEIAADPLFREAVTWQNTNAMYALDGLVKGGPDENRNNRRRRREELVAGYWQRYCGKNDTVGFFGPVTWITLDPDGPAVTATCGEGLVRFREVFYEYWALSRYAEQLADDPEIRPWLPVHLQPHLTLDGARLMSPDGPLPLSALAATLVARCDGRPAREVVEPEGNPAEGYVELIRLVERGILRWGVDLPFNPTAEKALRTAIQALPEERLRDRAFAGLHLLDQARTRVVAAAGDPDRLRAALADLDAAFETVTGATPEHRQGQMYAGRRLCYEETVRDLDVTIGGPVLSELAGPLGILLPAARWLSVAMIDAYRVALRDLWDKLRPSWPDGVPLAEFWSPVMTMMTGDDRPADAVDSEFTRRWYTLLGLDRVAPGTRRVELRSADLAELAAALFPGDAPGWLGGRIHSPDLHLCATDVDALNRGEFTAVLGELHAAWPTLDCSALTDRHPDADRLRAAARADLGRQLRPLYPVDYPRYTGRIAPNLGDADFQLGYTAAPGADPDRLLPITAMTVTLGSDGLLAVLPDGRSWPLVEVFALFFGWLATETFKLSTTDPHSPRVTVDRLTVMRETWRTTVGAAGLDSVNRADARYLAARRWRRELGLPERVFVKVATEVKPVFVDLTSLPYVGMLGVMMRSGRQAGGDDVPVTITEMLPEPDQAWVPDAAGRRYFSELRIQLRDPNEPVSPGGRG